MVCERKSVGGYFVGVRCLFAAAFFGRNLFGFFFFVEGGLWGLTFTGVLSCGLPVFSELCCDELCWGELCWGEIGRATGRGRV